MVSNLSMINMAISIFVIFILPVLFFWKFKSKKGLFLTMSAGAMGFFVAQYVVRLPLLNAVLLNENYAFIFDSFLLYAFILGVSAAFFELLFRIIVLKLFMRGYHQKHHILAAGFGHGIIEAILIVGLSYINNLIVAFYINAGRVQELVSEGTDPGIVNQLIESLTNANSWVFLVGGIERVLIVAIHMALTVLAFKGLKSKNRWKFWGLAFVIHAILDFGVVILQLTNVSIVVIEIGILAFAILSFMIIKQFMQSPEKMEEKQV